MKRVLPALALLLACPAHAQELTLLLGGIRESEKAERSYAWAVEYQQAAGEHLAASISWMNEGHVPGHHRDGLAAQIWGRASVLGGRLSLAAGVGPYRYLDTVPASQGDLHANVHGWGAIGTLAATYYTDGPWSWQLRANRIVTDSSIDTNSLMFGFGYRLGPVSERGPLTSASDEPGKDANNEIALFFGRTIVNSYRSEHAPGAAIEYRRRVARHFDASVSLTSEADTGLVRRTGAAAQVWGVGEFLAGDRLKLGLGFGPHLATDVKQSGAPGESDPSRVSWMYSAMASYRFDGRWTARFSWNRIATTYDRDADLLLFGLGYRF